MITALEAKLNAYRRREWFDIVDKKIKDTAVGGGLMCNICVDDIPNGTEDTLYEIAGLLNELGYQTMFDVFYGVHDRVLYIYWHAKREE